MTKIGKTEIELAVLLSKIEGYTGNYTELGGGELNDTFLLNCEPIPVILRVAKYEDSKNGLRREARSLSLLNSNQIPKLIYFNPDSEILGRSWIIESYISGTNVPRLSLKQFESFGSLLAKVHSTKSADDLPNPWSILLDSCTRFGNEEFLLSHPDTRLQTLLRKAKNLFVGTQSQFSDIKMSLVHGDATPSNVLTEGNEVGLIDWELSGYNDPMAEFSTIYYDDIEFNQGKWRIKIEPTEKEALFTGYVAGGGSIAEDRIKFWMNHDKLGAAVFLYWRINDSGRPADSSQITQYKLDLENLTTSLEQNL